MSNRIVHICEPEILQSVSKTNEMIPTITKRRRKNETIHPKGELTVLSPVALLLNKTTAKTVTPDKVQHADWHAINTKQKPLNKKKTEERIV